jgi:hypothetical protein
MIPLSMNTILSRAVRMLYSCPSRCNYRLLNLADHWITALKSQTLVSESSFYILHSPSEMRRSSTYFTFGLLSIPTNQPDRETQRQPHAHGNARVLRLHAKLCDIQTLFLGLFFILLRSKISIGLNTKRQLANSIPSPFIQLDRHNPSSATLGFRSAANM